MTAPKRSDGQTTSAGGARPVRRRWRDYKTPAGRSPVEKFIDGLSDDDAAAVFAGMQDVRDRGLQAARHLDGEIWEVRVDGNRVIYRILFAPEGTRGQVLLALEGLNKKTQKTPPRPRSRWRSNASPTGGDEDMRSAPPVTVGLPDRRPRCNYLR